MFDTSTITRFVATIGVVGASVASAENPEFVPTTLPTVGAPNLVRLADIDSDGDLDLIVAGQDLIEFFTNDGDGVFSQGAPAISGATIADVQLADLDGDGDLDLIVCSTKDPSAVYFNDGAGDFTLGQTFSPGAIATACAVEDFDRDGDLDVYLGISGASRLFLNDGAGALVDAGLSFGSGNTNTVNVGDIDNDGDLDLIETIINSDVRVFTNFGPPAFFGQLVGPLPYPAANGAALFDADRDGDLDLYLSQSTLDGSSTSRLLLNDGDANFTDAGVDLPSINVASGAGVIGVATGDMNADGYIDLVQSDVIYNGPDLFGSAPAQTGLRETEVLDHAVGDIDRDGDLDYARATMAGNVEILFNEGAPVCEGDVNGDDTVDSADLAILLGSWGPCP